MSNRLLSFARIAPEVATRAVPERAHRFAPQRYTQSQLLACLLIKEYLKLDYRTAQETLELSDGLRQALGLNVVPDYSTLWRFAHDKATADVLAKALEETVPRSGLPRSEKYHQALGANDLAVALLISIARDNRSILRSIV